MVLKPIKTCQKAKNEVNFSAGHPVEYIKHCNAKGRRGRGQQWVNFPLRKNQ